MNITAATSAAVVNADANGTINLPANYAGTLHANSGKTLGLLGTTIAATATITGPGTVVGFTQLRLSGQQPKYVTIPDGVEQNRAIGSTYVVDYSAASAFGFLPNRLTIGGTEFSPGAGGEQEMVIDTGAKTCTLTIPSDFALGSAAVLLIMGGDTDTILNIDTITVTAAASGGGGSVAPILIAAGLI